MPFQKGNKLGSMNKGKKSVKTQQWENIVGWLAGKGGEAFLEKLHTLSVGAEMTREEKEFIGHYKDLLEYHQPKLSRQELGGIGGGAIQLNTVKYGDNDSA